MSHSGQPNPSLSSQAPATTPLVTTDVESVVKPSALKIYVQWVIFGALFGAFSLVVGNAILRASHLGPYTHEIAATSGIGAVGVTITLPAAIFIKAFFKIDLPEPKSVVEIYFNRIIFGGFAGAIGAFTGTIGTAILLLAGIELGEIDILHATRAGALGGATFVCCGLLLFGIYWIIIFVIGAVTDCIDFLCARRNEIGTEDCPM